MDRIYYGRYPAAGLSSYYLRDFPQFDKLLVGTDPVAVDAVGAHLLKMKRVTFR
jgi:hypothetical protein